MNSRLSFLNILTVWLIYFLVACGSDEEQTIAPEVADVSPEENQDNVPLTTDLQAVFNLAVEPSSVNQETFLLFDEGTLVPSAVEYDEILFTATLTPNDDLSTSHLYTAMITDGVTGLDGTKIVPVEWNFTTVIGATYKATFQASWSSTTHPTDFPSGSHFSGLIGMTHNDNILMFEAGTTASMGIGNMAETGSKSPLLGEIGTIIDEGSAQFVISGGGVNPSPGSVSVEFTITSSHPLVTITSMIAPSPDWFVAVESVNLFPNGEALNLVKETVEVYDAGTDSGTNFKSANQPTEPPGPISMSSMMTRPFSDSPTSETDSTNTSPGRPETESPPRISDSGLPFRLLHRLSLKKGVPPSPARKYAFPNESRARRLKPSNSCPVPGARFPSRATRSRVPGEPDHKERSLLTVTVGPASSAVNATTPCSVRGGRAPNPGIEPKIVPEAVPGATSPRRTARVRPAEVSNHNP